MKILFVIGSMMVAGCAGQARLDPVIQKAPPVSIPVIQPLTLNPVQWKVLNANDLRTLASKVSSNSDTVLFVLEPSDYQNLSLNLIDIKRFLIEQKSVIILLKKVVDQQSDPVSVK